MTTGSGVPAWGEQATCGQFAGETVIETTTTARS